MSKELPGITKEHFLSGLPFYYQLQPYFTYRFSADNARAFCGILITEQSSSENRSVSNIHEKGFTLTLMGKPVNIEFAKCHTLDAMLSKTALLGEKQFTYHGNFTHLREVPLRFNKKTNKVIDEKHNDQWDMHSVNDTHFAVLSHNTAWSEFIIKSAN